MANYRYFAEIAGETVSFPQPKVGYRTDPTTGKDALFGWYDASQSWIKIARKIEYKQFASKHVCDDRCLNATGRVMKCECSCGGKNHGKGRDFTITRQVAVAF